MSEELVKTFKVSPNDFTRKRRQSFASTICFIMNLVRKSLSLEIENFVSYLQEDAGNIHQESFTKSAFVQYRKKIKPEVFTCLSDQLVEEFYTDNDESVKLWNGFRVLSVDGARISLPNTEELKLEYGESKNQSRTGTVQGRVSVLYDLLNGLVLDASLSSLTTGESTLAHEHLQHAKMGDLIIYDRGYPSFKLVHSHNKSNIDFLIRVKVSFSSMTQDFHDSGMTSLITSMTPGDNTKGINFGKNETVKVRLTRIDLGDQATEILITSLLDETLYPTGIFKELYFKRWGIETFYDEFKNKIRVENFSGYSKQSIQQDFRAAIFVSNIQSLIVGEINDELSGRKTNNRYTYKTNANLSYGFLKNRIIDLFFFEKDVEEPIEELKELLMKHLVPVRNGRSSNRNTGKYRNRLKPKITKNFKDAI